MGQIRKINDVFYIEFYARGLLYSQVAGENLENAQKLLAEVEAKIAGGEALTIARYIELPDFYERFLSEISAQDTCKSVERFSSTIKHFSGFLAKEYPQIHKLDQVTPAILESYKVYLIKSQKVKIVNLTILLIREILEYGIKLGFLNDNPSLHLRLLVWPVASKRKATARFKLAKELLLKGIGIGKLARLLKLSDVSKVVYFSNIIPLTREDAYI